MLPPCLSCSRFHDWGLLTLGQVTASDIVSVLKNLFRDLHYLFQGPALSLPGTCIIAIHFEFVWWVVVVVKSHFNVKPKPRLG